MFVKQSEIIEHVAETIHQAPSNCNHPFITLSFAQSLDGSLTAQPGTFLQISGPQSHAMTHQLRAMHEAILVGINTVLVDNPRLNVRLVEGKDPRPVIVDSHLRIPLQAKLLQRPDMSPIIATTVQAPQEKETRLREIGAEVLRLPEREDDRVSLPHLLVQLKKMGIHTLMVEGGARIITSFLAARLANQLVLTISPMFVAGVRAVQSLDNIKAEHRPRLNNVHYEIFANDIVMRGDFETTEDLATAFAQPDELRRSQTEATNRYVY